jgi:hypothetical protein
MKCCALLCALDKSDSLNYILVAVHQGGAPRRCTNGELYFRSHAMRKAPSSLAAALTLAVFLCLGTIQASAQCQLCVAVQDLTCSGTWGDCQSSRENCESTTFTVPCNTTYRLRAWIDCDNCLTCSCCAWVVKHVSGSLVGFVESGCPAEDCESEITITLDPNITYDLVVCKRPCDIGDDCDDCTSYCKAKAAVYTPVSSEPCGP